MRSAILPLAIVAALLGPGQGAGARSIRVAAGLAPLQQALDGAEAGDTLLLQPGTHRGPVVIRKPLALVGAPGASVEGTGTGSVVLVDAADVRVQDLALRGSGQDLQAMDAGVFLTERAQNARIEGNHIAGNLYGVVVHGAADAVIASNQIDGMITGRTNQFGNGVSVWNAPGAQVLDNDIRFGRDGIFSNASRNNAFIGNRFRNLRFAVHYMYTNDSTVADNISRGNIVGYAIMFSDRLKVVNNMSDGDRDNGLLLNAANDSVIHGNRVYGRAQAESRWASNGQRFAEGARGNVAENGATRLGPEKCVFIYNSNRNRFSDNLFEGCAIGVHFTAGSEGNGLSGNAFIGNRTQVKYVGTRSLDWSKDRRGNYWSDNPAFDLDGDGIADQPYRPNDIVDRLLWKAPAAKLLLNSPAIAILRFAQAHFPALFPGGVADSYPLMRPPRIISAERQ